MLFVKIPWALTRVYVNLDIQEMENSVVVRTVSKKYRKKTSDHFNLTPFFFQQNGLKFTQFPCCRSACIDSEAGQLCLRASSPFQIGSEASPATEGKSELLGAGKKERSQLSQGFHFWFNWAKRSTIWLKNNLPAINIFSNDILLMFYSDIDVGECTASNSPLRDVNAQFPNTRGSRSKYVKKNLRRRQNQQSEHCTDYLKMIAITNSDSKSITYHPQKPTFFLFLIYTFRRGRVFQKLHSCDVNAVRLLSRAIFA